MVTGDKNVFKPGTSAYERFMLQKGVVEELEAVFWGRGSMWPKIPNGPFDVVTVQDPFWRGLFAWYVSRKKKARFNVQVHTDFDAETSKNFIRHFLGVLTLRHADSIRVVSEKVKKQIEKYTPTPIFVLPIFVDIDKILSAAPANLDQEYPQVRQFGKVILVASRLEPEKNVGAAIDLINSLVKRFPTAGMLIAGKGSEEGQLKKKVRDLKLEENILFIGYRNDMGSIYKIADVLLLPSKFESYGASIVEALAAGIPVVSEDVGIHQEAAEKPIITSFRGWDQAISDIFTQNTKGKLKLSILPREKWAEEWKKTL